MRIVAILAVSVAVLMPALASADPGQTPTTPAVVTPATPATSAPTAPAPVPVQQTAQATPAAAANDADLDRIECRMGTPPTGTRLGATRECHTVRQWNQREQDAQEELKRTQMLGHEGAMSAPGGK